MTPPSESDAAFAADRLADGCDTMKKLLLGLLDSSGRVADEVHAIRKLGKSLRGGFSLFGLRRSASREIQVIGRLLAGPRDAVSRFKTWNKLGWNDDPKTAAAITGLLKQQTHSAARRPPKATIDWCLERVNTAVLELQNLPPQSRGTPLKKGLKRLERNALRHCRKLKPRKRDELHETRKALKAWLGAVGFLPPPKTPDTSGATELADLLGDENDLATLATWLNGHGFTPKFAPDLWKAVKDARNELQKDAVAKAERLASAFKP